MTLSQQRADTVRQRLISQGLSADTITSKGLGQADPIADNNTVAGRKQNRRCGDHRQRRSDGVQMSK